MIQKKKVKVYIILLVVVMLALLTGSNTPSYHILPGLPQPITNHQSPITNHQSPITNHQSPITNHQSPITNHQSPQSQQPSLLIYERSIAPFVGSIVKKTRDARAVFDGNDTQTSIVLRIVFDTLEENLATLTKRTATQSPEFAVAIFGASTGESKNTDDRVQPLIRRTVSLRENYTVTGVLVEPDPLNFGILQRNMKGFDRLELFNGVISNNCTTPTLPFHAPSPQFIVEEPKAPHHQIYQIGSLSEQNFKKAFWYNYTRYHHVYEIKCGLSKELFQRNHMAGKDVLNGAPHVLQVDVQGLDHFLIKDVLTFTRPLVLIYEDENRSKAQILEIRAQLSQMKYLYFDDGSNTIAVHVGNELDDAELAELQQLVKPIACRSSKLCKSRRL